MSTTEPGQFRFVAATFTPFDESGRLDLPTIHDHVASLLEQGVDAAFVCGTTGESASLTVAERKTVLAEFVAAASGRIDVIAHVGHASLSDARDLAVHAESLGVSAVAATAPYFFRPGSIGELVECCAEVAAAAPSTPFVYYHMPSLTGVALPMARFWEAASAAIPTFRGVKYTHEDLFDFSGCLDRSRDPRDVYFGRDEILLSAIAMGARSAVGTTYSFAAALFRRIADAALEGDLEEARSWQSRARRIVEIAASHGGLPALKAMMSIAGVPVGRTRRPLRVVDAEETAVIERELVAAGVRDYLGAP